MSDENDRRYEMPRTVTCSKCARACFPGDSELRADGCWCPTCLLNEENEAAKCIDCGISNATTWHQHDTGCTVAKALRGAEVAAEEARVPPPAAPYNPIQERVDYYRAKHYGKDVTEALTLIAIEEVNRQVAESHGQRASEIVEGYEALLASSGRPLVRHGDVRARTYVELGQAFHRLQTLEAFSARVKAAAADAAEWSALRDEVRK